MTGIPASAPNYSSVRPLSAWWLENLPDGSRRVYATTGYWFVTAMQEALRRVNYPPVISVFGGRGDVPSQALSSIDTFTADGNWSSVDTALLWYWLKRKRDAETNPTTQHAIQHAMDELERIISAHPLPTAMPWSHQIIDGAFVPLEALRAAIWLTQYPDQSYQYVIDRVVVDGGPQLAADVVTPPYSREAAPRPATVAGGTLTIWNPDPIAAAAPTGMSYGTKVLIGVGVVAAVGAGWYYWSRRAPAHAQLPSPRGNPYESRFEVRRLPKSRLP